MHARTDAVYCTKSCRQAAHRAKVGGVASIPATVAVHLRLAYADPPYPGLARRHYETHPDYAGEVDHHELLERLQLYDGWALSTSATALPFVVSIADEVCRRPFRVAAWVRGGRPHPHARLRSTWEPVIFSGGRDRRGNQVDDSLVGPTPRRRTTLPTAVVGAKPPLFCSWVFDLLGAEVGDTLDDLYPGSGIVGRTWDWYVGRDPARPDLNHVLPFDDD